LYFGSPRTLYFFYSKEEPVRTVPLGDGWIFIYSSASPKGCGGVGFILSPHVKNKLDGFKLVNSRIIRLQFAYSKELKSFFYSVYSPFSILAGKINHKVNNIEIN
jgi:hypothetical protein